ncbi:efflux transporter outer membrane subunit [Altererythrobacter sp. FM1]|nr:efflux transporter outer membrane subunit [Altererythrobacter sp. FM1]
MPHSPSPRSAVKHAASALALVALLSGCAAPDPGARPQMRAPATLASHQSLSIGPVAAEWPDDRWWARYGDTQLDALVAEALANSPTVAQAAARVRAARGLVERAGAAGMPQLNASGDAGAKKQSYNNGIPADFVPKGWKSYGTLSLGASFDLDLWGKHRDELAAATSEALATEVDAREAALALESNVVEAYTRLNVLFEEEDLLTATADARQQSVDLYAKRYASGLDSQLPQRQAETQLAGAKAALEANAEQIALQRHVIAALLGAGPDRGLSITRSPLKGPFARIPVPADAGIALAGRRADIVAARLRVEAQGQRIDVARKAFLPDINLSGVIGLMSLGVSNLFDSGSDYGNASGAISLPLFDGGDKHGNLVQARGQYDTLVSQYNATVVQALKEVADALSSRASVEQQAASAEQAARSAAQAYRLADDRYRAGLSTYLDVLTAQTAMLSAQKQALETRSRLVLTDIQLVRALGGGYAESDAAQTGTDRP